ncbi:PLP-dependent transferase [Violaceomyces palustris]|uniref:PLP-dependent transferase n=1 Tax=Violaceomyces palustris TaxID=1673888 RepID=A0ACD0NW06_9BASI|nr:PLP-dependent transferase [Violaceomyces palustris]
MLNKQLEAALEARKQKGTLRNLTNFPSSSFSPSGGSEADEVELPLVDFSSNDYLSLSTCPVIRRHFIRRLTQKPTQGPDAWRLGSTGSRLLDGNSTEHEELESRLASHFGSESALLFNSGFDANVSLFSTLPQPGDIVLYDSLVHASVHDGLRNSRSVQAIPFRHNDVAHLDSLLRRLSDQSSLTGRNVFVGVEAVYSMDGDLCPLDELVEVAERYVTKELLHVIVDEAHSTAVYGEQGKGLCQALGLTDRIRVRLMTFGKAMGTCGAAVLCSPLIRHYLINYARPLIFSTALSHPTVSSIHCSLDALMDGRGDERSSRLFENTRLLHSKLLEVVGREVEAAAAREGHPPSAQVGQPTTGERLGRRKGKSTCLEAGSDQTPSPIVPLLTTRARELAAHLRSKGLLARSICYPTVPKGEDRVRICVHYANESEDIERLVKVVADWCETIRGGEMGRSKKEEERGATRSTPRKDPRSPTRPGGLTLSSVGGMERATKRSGSSSLLTDVKSRL